MQTTLDLYTDYLLSSFGQTSATGLSRLTDGVVGHDAVTDLLNRLQGDNRTLWQHVKPLIRQIQEADGVLLTDDSIAHKPHSDENGLVTTHYDHTSGQYVRGINFVSLLYQTSKGQCPLSFEPVIKNQQCDRAAGAVENPQNSLAFRANQAPDVSGYGPAGSPKCRTLSLRAGRLVVH